MSTVAAVPAWAASVVPSAWLMPPTGIGPSLVMVTLVSGPSVLLEMTAATAPAAAAFSDFCSKVQPPRRIRATAPVKTCAAKSVASQPVVASSGTTRWVR